MDDRFGDLVKELVWRCKKMRLLNLAQEYHVTLETLSAQFEAKEWQSKAEQVRGRGGAKRGRGRSENRSKQ